MGSAGVDEESDLEGLVVESPPPPAAVLLLFALSFVLLLPALSFVLLLPALSLVLLLSALSLVLLLSALSLMHRILCCHFDLMINLLATLAVRIVLVVNIVDERSCSESS